jgi:hypothetical protein
MSDNTSLQELDQMAFQILQAFGTIESTELTQLLSEINENYVSSDERTIAAFQRINSKIKGFGLEIKSVVLMEGEDNQRKIYHGVVNTEDDKASKDFGSDFNAQELQYFSSMLAKLLDDKYLSTAELLDMCPADTLGVAQAGNFLKKLQAQNWLQRDDYNNWIIGGRSYLELRTFLENTIISHAANVAANEKERREMEAEVNLLPQVLMY